MKQRKAPPPQPSITVSTTTTTVTNNNYEKVVDSHFILGGKKELNQHLANGHHLHYNNDVLLKPKSFNFNDIFAFLSTKNALFVIVGICVALISCLLFWSFADHAKTTSFDNKWLPSKCQNVSSNHRLAIVVPFRDRFDELVEFVPHMFKFLRAQCLTDFHIYVVNQVDAYRFNRASLINVGFLVATEDGCDYMAMHDVDLLPLNTQQLDYSYPAEGRVYHVAAPGLHPLYQYANFIGGILIVTKETFFATNGMSNRFWGWGREDDEYFLRLQELNIEIDRPNVTQSVTGKDNTFVNNHDPTRRVRDNRKFKKQRLDAHRHEHSGLHNVKYELKKRVEMYMDDQAEFKFTLLNVELFCNKQQTHWCEMSYQFL